MTIEQGGPGAAGAVQALSNTEFGFISQLLERQSGITLDEQKRPMVAARLYKRLRSLKLGHFEDYVTYLDGPNGPKEMGWMISALTTNVTKFFRENHHFDFLVTAVLPELVQKARAGQRVRIWSAGCSSGQEPYSLAMTVLSEAPELAKLDFAILASDIDPKMVAASESGIYAGKDVDALPQDYAQRFFLDSHTQPGMKQVRPELQETIHFRQLNLLEDWPFSGRFDVIFCRNVMIYFRRETQSDIWARFADTLHPGGYLFAGHSERVSGPAESTLSPCGITTYRKTDNTSD